MTIKVFIYNFIEITICIVENATTHMCPDFSTRISNSYRHLTTAWIHPWPIEVDIFSPFLNLTWYSEKDLDGLALYMRLLDDESKINVTLPNGWVVAYSYNDTKARLYEKQYGIMYLCQPWLINVPGHHSHLSCFNYTYYNSVEYYEELRYNFVYWYNYQQPAVSIMIAFSTLTTLTGVFGKFIIDYPK